MAGSAFHDVPDDRIAARKAMRATPADAELRESQHTAIVERLIVVAPFSKAA